MNSFYLKIVACVTMFLDHFARIFTPVILPLTYIGRFAFPIFAFQASIGYEHTKDLKKYIIRLLIFALISQIPYHFCFNTNDLNVIFTILLGIISIYVYEFLAKRNIHPLSIIAVAFIAYMADLLKTDYGWYGVLLIFLFHIAKDKKVLMTIGYVILTIILYAVKFSIYGFMEQLVYSLGFTLAAIVPILFYNGKQGKKTKYALYIFYPLHLFILYFARMIFL